MKNIFKLFAIPTVALLASCGGGDSSNPYGDDYKAACKADNFEAAHKIVDDYHTAFTQTWESDFGSMEWNNDGRANIEAAAANYATAAQYVLGYEARWLVATNAEDLPFRIKNLFSEIEPMGKKLADGTDYMPTGSNDRQKKCAQINCYKEYVGIVNNLCQEIATIAGESICPGELLAIANAHLLPEPVLSHESFHDVIRYNKPSKLTIGGEEDHDWYNEELMEEYGRKIMEQKIKELNAN